MAIMEQKALPTILTFFYKPVVSWRYPNMEAQLCSVHKLLYLLIIGKMICIDFILYNYPLNTNISSYSTYAHHPIPTILGSR